MKKIKVKYDNLMLQHRYEGWTRLSLDLSMATLRNSIKGTLALKLIEFISVYLLR